MICRYCNSNVREGAQFCPMCGKSLSVRVCTGCGAEASVDALFCQICGHRIGNLTCTTCGNTVKEGAIFCPNCGKSVMNQPFFQSAMAIPMSAYRQEPSSRGKKPHTGSLALKLVLITAAVAVAAVSAYFLLRQRTVTAEENNALWSEANIALTEFVAGDPALFESPVTPEKINKVTQLISDLDKALKALEAVKPPSDQTIVHEMLLPLYRGIYDQMVTIKDAMAAGDVLKTDLELQRLYVLLDELGGAAGILTT